MAMHAIKFQTTSAFGGIFNVEAEVIEQYKDDSGHDVVVVVDDTNERFELFPEPFEQIVSNKE